MRADDASVLRGDARGEDDATPFLRLHMRDAQLRKLHNEQSFQSRRRYHPSRAKTSWKRNEKERR